MLYRFVETQSTVNIETFQSIFSISDLYLYSVVCILKQGPAHSERQRIPDSPADHVQPGGEDL